MILYDYPRAPSPRRARILLAEKGIPHETVVVDLAAMEQLGEAYLAINPQGTVPALRLDDGTVLTDNAGIVAWAEGAYPDPPLLGHTPLEKAAVASWNARVEGEGFAGIAEAMRNTASAMKDRALPGTANYAQIPELAERGRARAFAFFDAADRRLEGRDYLATDVFTVADISLVVAADFVRVLRVDVYDGRPNLRRWRDLVGERRSVAL